MDNGMIQVQFFSHRSLAFGQSLNVIGNIEQLGKWDINKSIQMQCFKDFFWISQVNLPMKIQFEYKFYISDTNCKIPIQWDEGDNRKMRTEGILLNDTIRIMTFNIRYDNQIDGCNQWKNRKKMVENILFSFDCDFIGMQEVLYNQYQYLRDNLLNYNSLWRGRDFDYYIGEGCPIFYKFSKWKILDFEVFWLSNTPSVPASKSYGNIIPRICTWIKFQNYINNKIVHVYNSHFDHESLVAQQKGASQIKKHILDKISPNDFIILMGDFNCTPTQTPIEIVLKEGINLQKTFNEQSEKQTTFHNFFGQQGWTEHIDYILIDYKLTLQKYEIINKNFEGRYPSDHFPVVIEVTYKK